jgi:gamma-glutamylcyclotransferase (GGCT)/AIG2-like uncharacterized protein YtfP
MKTIAVYGSLKRGKYNHNESQMTRVGDGAVRGSMFMCYSYPHLYPVDRSVPEQVIDYPVEIYTVSDEYFARLDRMESGAGYEGVLEKFGDFEAIIWYKKGHGKDTTLPYITEY